MILSPVIAHEHCHSCCSLRSVVTSQRTPGGDLMDQCSTARHPMSATGIPTNWPGHDLDPRNLGCPGASALRWAPRTGSNAQRPSTHVDKGVFVAGSILGERVLRKEDPKFLTTGGVYVDDMVDERLAGAAHVVYVRSSAAHGTIRSIDADEARAMPGVLAVFTAADLELEPVPSSFNPTVARTLLASDKVRYVGEPIAAVVAETIAQGVDAAESVFVDIDFLPAVVDIESAATAETLLYESSRIERRVRHDRARDAREHRRGRLLRRLRGHRHRPVRQPASRAVPARGPRLGGGLDRRPAPPVGVDAARAGRARRRRRAPTGSTRPTCASSPPTSVAVSAPRSARTPRSCCSARSPSGSVVPCVGARPAASR